jgi:integrase/recombinase XerD
MLDSNKGLGKFKYNINGKGVQIIFHGFNPDLPNLTAAKLLPRARRSHRGSRPGGKAKMLTSAELKRVQEFILKRPSKEADLVKLLLSVMAALRACEISKLRVADVTNPDGSTANFIQIRPNGTKGKKGREVPICPELKDAINAYRKRYPDSEWLAVSHRYKKWKHQSPNAVTVWFHWLYKECGLQGCSSHSGRRTFITRLARDLGPDNSLRDLQVVVGHARLDTTQAYITVSKDVRKLVNRIGPLLSQPEGEQ